jgi:transcriptional regulator with XRE-family HTH domain
MYLCRLLYHVGHRLSAYLFLYHFHDDAGGLFLPHEINQDLADEMRVSLRTVQRMEMQAVIKDPERRRLLVGLLGIPAAYLTLDREEARPAAKTRLILNNDRMAFYEEQLEIRWKLLFLLRKRWIWLKVAAMLP